MRTFFRKYLATSVMFIIMVAVVVSLALADQPGNRRSGRGPLRSVAEPATIVLLGAGLASLGVYAFKKRKKR